MPVNKELLERLWPRLIKPTHGSILQLRNTWPTKKFRQAFGNILSFVSGKYLTRNRVEFCLFIEFIGNFRAYMNINKQLPDNIIVYRDGIGTGDIQNVLDIEVKGIQDACRLVDERRAPGGNRFTPGIAFIVVSKRINTRFFRKTTNSGIDNPPCGTVVDNTVTHDHRFDFFLISQKVTRATVSPTHFNVIYDTTGLGADAHQNMAYALTQLYYNWTVNKIVNYIDCLSREVYF